MKTDLPHLFATLSIALLTTFTVDAKSTSDSTYCNARYKFCVTTPKTITSSPESDNGDGKTFSDGAGFSMTASGIHKIDNESIKSEISKQLEDFDQVSYRAQGKNWFVLSGFKGENTVYEKTYVMSDKIYHLVMTYPTRQQKNYQATVRQIALSFKPSR